MKVLLVGTKHFADIRGAAIAYYGLATALRDRGHDVTFVQSARQADERRLEGVRHVYFDVPRKRTYPLIAALRSVRGFDVIHANDECGAYYALRHRVRPLPLVVQFQPGRIRTERWSRAHWRWRYNRIATRFAPAFVSPSRWIAEQMIAGFGIEPARYHVIPYGIGRAWFDAYPGPRAKPSGPIRIALVNMKGVDTALRAFSKAGGGIDARLELYGIDKQEGEHRALAQQLGIQDRVSFEGFVKNEDLARRLAEADVLLNPTPADGFGQVLGEAAALGIPAVSTDLDAVPEVVDNGVTGILCPLDDTDAFAAALRSLLENAALRERMGAAARARAERLWQWSGVVERIEQEIYVPLRARWSRSH